MKQYIFAMLIIIFTSSKLTYAAEPDDNAWAKQILFFLGIPSESEEDPVNPSEMNTNPCKHRYSYIRTDEKNSKGIPLFIATNCINCGGEHPSNGEEKTLEALRKETNRSNAVKKSYPCSGCDYPFCRKDNLTRHVKLFPCSELKARMDVSPLN